MGLGLDDLADTPGAHTVLGRQLHLVPCATLETVQLEGPLTGADEHILPLLAVVHRVLQHEACPGGLPGSGGQGGARGTRQASWGWALGRGQSGAFGHWQGQMHFRGKTGRTLGKFYCSSFSSHVRVQKPRWGGKQKTRSVRLKRDPV